MSRHSTRINDNLVLEYGFDRVPRPGYFFHAIRPDEDEMVEGGDTRAAMVVPPEQHMNRSEIVEKLRDYGAPDEHIEAMAMDQPL